MARIFHVWFREPGRPGLTVTPSKPLSFSSHGTLKLTNEKSVFGGTQAFHKDKKCLVVTHECWRTRSISTSHILNTSLIVGFL